MSCSVMYMGDPLAVCLIGSSSDCFAVGYNTKQNCDRRMSKDAWHMRRSHDVANMRDSARVEPLGTLAYLYTACSSNCSSHGLITSTVPDNI
jgi:hypothetical protein